MIPHIWVAPRLSRVLVVGRIEPHRRPASPHYRVDERLMLDGGPTRRAAGRSMGAWWPSPRPAARTGRRDATPRPPRRRARDAASAGQRPAHRLGDPLADRVGLLLAGRLDHDPDERFGARGP